MMLIGHADPPTLLFKLIYGFHMPFFFLLSGYLYNAEKYARMRFRPYCKTRFAAYMIPYFAFAFCNLLVNLPFEIRQGITGKALLSLTAKHASSGSCTPSATRRACRTVRRCGSCRVCSSRK